MLTWNCLGEKMTKNSVFDKISEGKATFEYRKSLNPTDWLNGVLSVFSHSVLPFMVATRFKFKSIDDVFSSDEIFRLKESSRSSVELLELFLAERCKREGNTAFDGRDFHAMFRHDRFRPYLNEKMREFRELELTGNLSWKDEEIFTKLALLTTTYDRKKLGSISTPLDLVCEIIDQIDFRNIKSILDPACGRGPFLYRAKELLINCGLSEHDAIMSLHGMDKDERLCYLAQAILDPNQICEPIITHADSLKYDWKNMKFDLVIGNPPYNKAMVKPHHSSYRHIGMNSEKEGYIGFFIEGLKLLKDNGILSYVTPGKFMMGPGAKNFRNWLVDNYDLNTIKAKPNDTFEGVGLDKIVITTIINRPYAGITEVTHMNGVTVSIPLNQVKDHLIIDTGSVELFQKVMIMLNQEPFYVPGTMTQKIGDYGIDLSDIIVNSPSEEFCYKIATKVNNDGTYDYKYTNQCTSDSNTWRLATKMSYSKGIFALLEPGVQIDHTLFCVSFLNEEDARSTLEWTRTDLFQSIFDSMKATRHIHTFIRYISKKPIL